MDRIPEPELMDTDAQARAYAEADFEAPHSMFIELLREAFPRLAPDACVLDLGCGPGDITLRFARAYPECRIHGVDGAAAMLDYGHRAVAASGLGGQVTLVQGLLPGAALPRERYDAIISNSLLHHLADPAVLWQAVRTHGAPGAPVFVMDLMRPESVDEAHALLEQYATGEPEVLRQDFFHSLLAAYRVPEVEQQLRQAGLDGLRVEVVSDRHLTVRGTLR